MRTFITEKQTNDFFEELKTMDAEIVKGAILEYVKDAIKSLKRCQENFDEAETIMKNYGKGLCQDYQDSLWIVHHTRQEYDRLSSARSKYSNIMVALRKYRDEHAPQNIDKRVNIENLNQLKKALCKGARFNILHNDYKPEFDGQKRIVQATQSNCIFSGVFDDEENKLNTTNNGKGLRLDLDKTRLWEFDNGVCSCFAETNTWENGKQVTKRHKWLSLEVVA